DQDLGVVVDAGQQHGLVEQGDAPFAQSRGGRGDLVAELARVIGMHHQHRLQASPGQPVQQVGVDAAGQHDGQAAVDAQPAQVGNGRQLARQLAQPAVVENQRVAPAQNHFADVRARSDIVEGGGETAGGGVGLGVGKVPAEAVAAMNGAGAGDYQ